MTIALDRPATLDRTPARPVTGRPLQRAAAPVEDGVTITLTLTLPAGTGDVEAALIADELRSHAQRQTATRQGRTSVSVNSPHTFRATGAVRSLPPRRTGEAAISPLRPRRGGVVSPNSPARRDAEAARRRALQATAVSPSSASSAPDDSLVADLYGRRVRIDGTDVDLTYKEFELLAHLARMREGVKKKEMSGPERSTARGGGSRTAHQACRPSGVGAGEQAGRAAKGGGTWHRARPAAPHEGGPEKRHIYEVITGGTAEEPPRAVRPGSSGDSPKTPPGRPLEIESMPLRAS